MAHTRVKCAHFFKVPSGDGSANPAPYGILGCSDLQRTFHTVSAWVHCVTGVLPPSEDSIGEVCVAVPCWRAISGHRAYYSTCTRSQSREADTLNLPAWRLLLNVSQWVLQIVEKGYRIQFGFCPPHFNGMLSTVVSSEQTCVPLPERDSGFYSR